MKEKLPFEEENKNKKVYNCLFIEFLYTATLCLLRGLLLQCRSLCAGFLGFCLLYRTVGCQKFPHAYSVVSVTSFAMRVSPKIQHTWPCTFIYDHFLNLPRQYLRVSSGRLICGKFSFPCTRCVIKLFTSSVFVYKQTPLLLVHSGATTFAHLLSMTSQNNRIIVPTIMLRVPVVRNTTGSISHDMLHAPFLLFVPK